MRNGHLRPGYQRRRNAVQDREFRAAQRRRAELRWAEAHNIDEPARVSRVVELTILDSHRARRFIRLQAEPLACGWSRWRVTENGARIGKRGFGSLAVAKLIAASL